MIEFFSMLHLQEGEHSAVNVHPRDFSDQIRIYLGNALTLSNSLKARGLSYTLLTNDKPQIDMALASYGAELNVVEIPCVTQVPHGIPFFSAFFKFDALRYFSQLDTDYVALCDVDMICINNLPPGLARLVDLKTPLWYDVSDLVIPTHGHESFFRDMDVLLARESEGRWAGGEFIAGPPAFFAQLINEIDTIYPNYVQNVASFYHGGDEFTVSVALEILRHKGVYIADVGPLGIVGRYWNYKTLHVQKPFACYEHCFMLHLPSDKRFLASLADKGSLSREQFLHKYAIQRYKQKIKRIRPLIVTLLRKFLKRHNS